MAVDHRASDVREAKAYSPAFSLCAAPETSAARMKTVSEPITPRALQIAGDLLHAGAGRRTTVVDEAPWCAGGPGPR